MFLGKTDFSLQIFEIQGCRLSVVTTCMHVNVCEEQMYS